MLLLLLLLLLLLFYDVCSMLLVCCTDYVVSLLYARFVTALLLPKYMTIIVRSPNDSFILPTLDTFYDCD